MPLLTDIDHTIDYDEIPLEAFDPNDGEGMARWITENSIIFARMLARLKVLGEAYDSLALRLGLKNNVFSLVWYPEFFYYDADTGDSTDFVDYESVGIIEIVEDPISLQYFLKCSGSVVFLDAPHTVEDGEPETNDLEGSYVYVALPAAADLIDGARYWTGHLSTMFVTVDETGDTGLENFLCGVIGTDGIENKKCRLFYSFGDTSVGYVRGLLPSFFLSQSSFNFDLLFPVTEEAVYALAEEYLAEPEPPPPPPEIPVATTGLLAWYDPSYMGSLWKDTAGTDPVTAVDDVVKRIDDLSGNGYHIEFAFGNCLYKESGGLKYIQCIGAALKNAAFTDLASTATAGIYTAFSSSGDNAPYFVIGPVANANWFQLFKNGSNVRIQTATGQVTLYPGGSMVFGDPNVYSVAINFSNPSATKVGVRLNGVVSTQSSGTPTSTAWPSNTDFIQIGANTSSGGDASTTKRWYGFAIYSAALTGDDLTLTESALATRAGVTL